MIVEIFQPHFTNTTDMTSMHGVHSRSKCTDKQSAVGSHIQNAITRDARGVTMQNRSC